MKLKVLILLGVALLVRPNVYGADNKYVSELDSICASVAYRTVEYSNLVEHGINSWEQLLSNELGLIVRPYSIWNEERYCVEFFVNGKHIYEDTDESVISSTNERYRSRRAFDEICRYIPLYEVKRVYYIHSSYLNSLKLNDMAHTWGPIVMIITNKTIKL